jgi:flavin reductase (DIM6/NTAB) family NADH-FMN oxidoreductase RutF
MEVLSQFWAPLCAVGSHGPHGPNAQICLSVLGASIVPEKPRLIVNLSKTNYTHDLVAETGQVSVTVLAVGQEQLLERLGLASGREAFKLDGLTYEVRPNECPVFPGGRGYVEGDVIDSHDFGDSTAFLVAVTGRETWDGAEGLRWHDARERIGEDFMRRWLEKSEREQAAARAVMRWR